MNISVVIPCHNGAKHLGQTIGSVLEQMHQPFEVIVVVDNSTDDSARIALNFGPQIKVCEVNFGLASKTRNLGAKLSSGDAILFLDADDVLGPNALLGLHTTLQSKADGVAYIPWKRLEQSGAQWIERRASVPRKKYSDDPLAAWLTGHYYPPCCLLWSRSAFEAIGGWSEEFCPNDDGDLACRAMIAGIRFHCAQIGLAYYRRIPELDSLSGTRFTERGLRARLRVWEKLAAWLEEKGFPEKYHFPLAYSLREIIDDAEKHSCDSVSDRGRELASYYDLCRIDLSPKKTVSQRLHQAANKLGLNRDPYRNGKTDIEITYGQATSRRSLASPRDGARAVDPISALPPVPTVSVIIPTYNRSKLVCRAIRSVLAQTFSDLEVIVVDDASTDNTQRTVKKFDDPRIRYIKQPENRDVSAARNRGLRAARGEFIAFLDSDDEWMKQKLDTQIARFRTLPESVGLVYSGSIQEFDDGHEKLFTPKHRGNVFPYILANNITDTGSASVIIRRNVIRVVGFFDERIPAMEDYDYWIRIVRFYEFDFVPQPLVRYHESRTIDRRSRIPDKDKLAREQLFAKFHRLFNHYHLVDAYHEKSAKRLLKRYRQTDRKAALKASLKAITANPKAKQAYKLTLQSVTPRRLWGVIQNPRSVVSKSSVANSNSLTSTRS